MKKLWTLMIACLLLVTTASSAFAATLNLSYPQSNPDTFTIEPSSDGSALFIESTMSTSLRSFTHKYESDYYWSNTRFDVLCLGMNSNDQYPVLRCWIIFANDTGFKNIHSVTIELDGTRYTFTDIDDPDNWHRQTDTSYIEEMMIKFGPGNIEFLKAMEAAYDAASATGSTENFFCTMILHAANEDITVTLDEGFLVDFMLLSLAHRSLDNLSTFDRVIATPMTINGSSGGGGGGGGLNECSHCYGSGECSHCYGEGGEWCDSCFGSGDCGRCDGFGTIFPNDNTCTSCRGSGVCKRCKGMGQLECNYCDGSGFCNYCKGVGYR